MDLNFYGNLIVDKRNISHMAYTFVFAALLVLSGYPSGAPEQGGRMKIESSSFVQGQSIPQKCTCDGEDASPELHWSSPPQGTKTFALIADDPDAPAGTWVHWVIYNIPASTHALSEGLAKTGTISTGVQGLNDFRKTGYGGPCPPPGKPHRYFFNLFALDTQIAGKPWATKKDVEVAMQGHILASAELMGTYQRRSR